MTMLRPLACLILLLLAAPASAQDAADVIVRLNRLENQVRSLSGKIEELEYENRQLREQMRKFQEDVEFRFQERSGAPRSGPSPGAGTTPAPRAPAPTPPARRSDVFDPSNYPNAPGAPQPLGSTQPSAPLEAQPGSAGAPLALPGSRLSSIDDLIATDDGDIGGGALDLERTGRVPAPPPRTGPSIAATGTGDARADYEAAYSYLVQKQYEQAEMGFRRFIQSHPRDRLVPEATYWLGETYLQRNRHREAAEQFLNISTEHPGASKAPDALLKLGVALNAMGARDRACAVFAELDRKYPQASSNLREASGREQKRARCA